MYGYIKPCKAELKVKEFECYRAVYCGLCHGLKKNFGFFARFFVNFDFAFLLMLLSIGETPVYKKKRCVASPFVKKNVVVLTCERFAADCNIILSWWKIRDNIADEGLFKSLLYRLIGIFTPYNKAKKRQPKFDILAKEQLALLSKLEKENCADIDMVSDAFAKILEYLANYYSNEIYSPAVSKILFNVGKYIYIYDALCDYDDDIKRNKYNAIHARYKNLSPETAGEVRDLLAQSMVVALENYKMLPQFCFSPIIENILTYRRI